MRESESGTPGVINMDAWQGEYELVQQHPTEGARLLRGAPGSKLTLLVIRGHVAEPPEVADDGDFPRQRLGEAAEDVGGRDEHADHREHRPRGRRHRHLRAQRPQRTRPHGRAKSSRPGGG